MQTRTRLTTPPGQEPVAPESNRTADDVERYSPGLALPAEPTVAGRHRRTLVVIGALLVLGVAGFVAFRLLTAGQFQDPALTEEQPADAPAGELPGEELPGEEPTGTSTEG